MLQFYQIIQQHLSIVMESQPRELLLYAIEQEEAPFSLWLDSLRDIEARAKIRKRLDRLRLGNLGDYKAVGEGVYELRIDCGPGYRVYYGNIDLTIILLLCGGSKDTQEKDIDQAKQFWNDFKKRENANE
jgi:putative addiction module killer protein